jgi:cyclic pyranopterin phosphate synthase
MTKLTHLDEAGRAAMVDVGEKTVTERMAVARGRVAMRPETLRLIIEGDMKKGDVLAVAQVAGIMAAKRASELIPLCHPLLLNQVAVTCVPNVDEDCVDIEATVRVSGKTGVEMEALTAVTVAGLTIYDMAKAVDRGMRLTDVRLVRKSGGRSGDWEEAQGSRREREQG